MATDAGSLLSIMKTKVAMQRAVPHALQAFQVLVDKLSAIDPVEAIDVQVLSEKPLHARYVRLSTGEILVELHE